MRCLSFLVIVLMMSACLHPKNPWSNYPYFLVPVKAGDTLAAISDAYDVPVSVLQIMNEIDDPRQLRVGSYIKVALRSSNRSLARGKVYNLAEREQNRAARVPAAQQGLLFGSQHSMLMPVQGLVSSGFGRRGRRMHEGIDIRAQRHTPIVAAAQGRVVFSGWKRGYGRTLILRHQNLKTLYAHCQKLLVKKGQWVLKGQTIATVGQTGRASGPHLHFEVQTLAGVAMNPFSLQLADR